MAGGQQGEMNWLIEVTAVSNYFERRSRELNFFRLAVSALGNGKNIDENANFYAIYDILENEVTLHAPSVLYLILQSVDYPHDDLQRIRGYVRDEFNLSNNFTFDLMLAMINIMIRMSHQCYENYKFQISNLFPNPRPHITTRANLLLRLLQGGHFEMRNVLCFRNTLRTADCQGLHGPLTELCQRYSIAVSPWPSIGKYIIVC